MRRHEAIDPRRRGILPIGSRSGFTLIEVILALTLVGMAVTVVLQLFSSSLRNISISDEYVRAGIRAESRIGEILDDTGLVEGRWSESTPDGYRIDVEVSPVKLERSQVLALKLFRIDLTVAWRQGAKNRAVSFSTLKLVGSGEEKKEATAS